MDTSIKGYAIRIFKMIFGLAFAALGVSCTVNANLGLSPWDVFSQGIAIKATEFLGREIMIGTVIQIVGVFVLIGVIVLKEKIGISTICDIAVFGWFLNIYLKSGLIPTPQNFILQLCLLLVGFCIWGVGVYIYMSAGLGTGPRDGLMVALAKRNIPVSLAKNGIEFIVFAIGWAMGGKIGIGTIIAVVIMGYILKIVFAIFRFDVTKVYNESILESLKNIKANFAK